MLARSNVVLEGCWEQREESERALKNGRFQTGDGGVIGDDGYLTIYDRKKDVVITGGENVSSIEFRDELARTATGKLQKFKAPRALLGRPRAPGQLKNSVGFSDRVILVCGQQQALGGGMTRPATHQTT